jgi:hypothetical protein
MMRRHGPKDKALRDWGKKKMMAHKIIKTLSK